MKKVAVIMSVYKNDKLEYVKEALDSLYNQSYNNIDIFIQQDGIISNELENLLEGELKNSKICYLGKREDNKGLAYSLNELIQIVLKRGYEYIFRMDADDISVKDRVEYQLEVMEQNRDIDICGGWIEEFNTDSNTKQIVRYPQNHNDILNSMIKRNSIAHVTVCFRDTFFNKAGTYNIQKLNEDYYLWLEGFKNSCNFYNLKKVLVNVRVNNSFFNRRKNRARALELIDIKIQFVKKFNLSKMGYIYAYLHYILFLSPPFIKKIIYKNLRG